MHCSGEIGGKLCATAFMEAQNKEKTMVEIETWKLHAAVYCNIYMRHYWGIGLFCGWHGFRGSAQ